MHHPIIRLYAVLVSILFGIIVTAQLAGFAGLYSAPVVIPLTVLISAGATRVYLKFAENWLQTIHFEKQSFHRLQWVISGTAVSVVLLIFVQRMVFWYQSSVGELIPNDFVGYHAIKIFQLVNDGSVWNLAIPYGQYPFGLEGLVAFGMLFVPDLRVTGTFYAFVTIIFWLTIALMLVRYAQLSLDLSLLLALLPCFMPVVFAQVLNVGKNDVLLSTTILIAILHAPIGSEKFHPFGLAFATMLSLATKATGIYVLFYLWGLVMLNWFWQFRNGTARQYLDPVTFIALLLVMFPGGLWIIRNYIVLGELYTTEVSSFFQTTIVANFDNPVLFQSYRSAGLVIYLLVALVMAVLALFKKAMGWQMSGLILTIIGAFMITPLAVFLTINDLDYVDVQWRFVLHGIVLLIVIAIAVLAPFIRYIYYKVEQNRALNFMVAAAMPAMVIMLILFLGVDDIFGRNPGQWQKMIDPTLQEGSIYDELAMLESGTVALEYVQWLPVLLNNPDLTLTQMVYPLGRADVYPVPELDYIAFAPVFTQTPVNAIYQADSSQWEVIFDDPTGRIYQRVR